MRLLIHALVILMILGLVGGLIVNDRQSQHDDELLVSARAEIVRFQKQLDLRMALAQGDARQRYPESIDPIWFNGLLPHNPMLSPGRPWVEIAGPAQAARRHPANIIAEDETVAEFWYNPYNGVIRARVPITIRDSEALDNYNYINDCHLTTLFPTRSDG